MVLARGTKVVVNEMVGLIHVMCRCWRIESVDGQRGDSYVCKSVGVDSYE